MAALQAAAPVASGQKRSRRSTVADGQLEAKLEPFLRACNQCGEEKECWAEVRHAGLSILTGRDVLKGIHAE